MKNAKISRLELGVSARNLYKAKLQYSHVLHEVVAAEFTTDILEFTEPNLGNDRAKLSASGRDTMGGRTIACRENFARYHECGHVRPKVLEEIGKTVEEDEALSGSRGGSQFVVSKALDVMLVSRSIFRMYVTYPGYRR